MSSREHHSRRGSKVGVEEYMAWKRQRGEEPSLVGTVCSAALGAWAANLADDLEPPTGPKHRSFLHSIEALALANQQYAARNDLPSKVFLRAYASHLKDDSRTTAGLPSATVKILRVILRRVSR